jgi:K+-sensing histidine kinase KdpD
MRRVLVPLDGSDLAASMLPDARRLAGSDGELVLVRDADDKPHYSEATAAAPLNYLEEVAEILRAEGVSVRIRKLTGGDIASAIDTAAKAFNVDMIAVATHGRHGVRRLLVRKYRVARSFRAVVCLCCHAHEGAFPHRMSPVKCVNSGGSHRGSRRPAQSVLH